MEWIPSCSIPLHHPVCNRTLQLGLRIRDTHIHHQFIMLFLNYSCSVIHISSSFSSNPKNNNNNLNHHKPTSLPISNNNSHSHDDDVSIKFKPPTPPWMTAPLLLRPKDLPNFSSHPNPNLEKRDLSDKSLTGKEVKGKRALKKIAHRVEKLHKAETQLGSKKVENFVASLDILKENEEVVTKSRMPWEKNEKIDFLKVKKEKIVTSADLAVDKTLLQRLRGEAAKMRIWVKVKKAGVTQDVVKEIKRTWRTNELAMVKFDIPLCQNMDRAREIVETKTGGLVVWSKKDALVVYRGCNYQLTSKASPKIYTKYIPPSQRTNSYETSEVQSATKHDDHYLVESDRTTSEKLSRNADRKDSQSTDIHDANYQPTSGSLYERECDRLLDGLGPRFIDWWMNKPLPVDADLLPEVVPGFEPPFRLCPPHTNVKLTDGELTYFRKISHPLPTHFVLGRNRGHQGLAAAILKLWHKSHIVKIAIKYGVQNTDNETMANELKRLTGGVLLLRNKFYILLYRGKDFLPKRVADLVERRELELKSCQLHEEITRLKAIQAFSSFEEFQLPQQDTSTSGSLTEYMEIRNKHENIKEVDVDSNVPLEAEIYKLEKELKVQQRKAFILNKKIERSLIELSKLDAAWKPSGEDIDFEMMTDEERECFRTMGLKMRSCLVLGRRGIFDGVLEGLHQHWKHREVAKVITMQRLFSRVIYTAQFMERESGGILVSVDKLKEGHAIIIYRGKNYSRPKEKIAKNLLTKRKALQRSLEMQRIGSLKFFAHQREKTISDLKRKLETLQQGKEIEVREFED